ncbi:hypothetical protein OHR68_03810 [Spirillospora sp. NBC_00431]
MTPPAPEPAKTPPVQQWPILTPPDCPTCQRPADVVWDGPATLAGVDLNAWHCDACSDFWDIPVTHWPVTDGPDCPYCRTEVTCWAALAPDTLGDLWTCEHGHEFVLTFDGFVITPGNEYLDEWARLWPRSNRARRDGDAA